MILHTDRGELTKEDESNSTRKTEQRTKAQKRVLCCENCEKKKKYDKQSLVFYERIMCCTDEDDPSFALCRVRVRWYTHMGIGHDVFWL